MKPEMKSILDKIKEYNKIILFRHFRPDGDAIGSTKGLQAILKATYPEKEVLLLNADYSDYLAFLGKEDAPRDDEYYKDALGIVIDTSVAKRISNKKFELCREIIKIDHHIPDGTTYADLEWIEEHRSSSCEMIAAFYDCFKDELKITSEAATYIYCGMVTDSGRFRYREVSGDTMRLAGMLLDVGLDTDTLYSNLYTDSVKAFKFEAYAKSKAVISENGVVSIFVSKRMQKKFKLSKEDASAVVSHLDSLRGCLIWIAFIEGDEEIRVRLRSRFVTVSELANRYNGGGHACAAGATVYSKKEMKALLAEADELLGKYKSEHEGWI